MPTQQTSRRDEFTPECSNISIATFLQPCLATTTGAFHKAARNFRETATTLPLPYDLRTGALRAKENPPDINMVSTFGISTPKRPGKRGKRKTLEPTETLISNRVVPSLSGNPKTAQAARAHDAARQQIRKRGVGRNDIRAEMVLDGLSGRQHVAKLSQLVNSLPPAGGKLGVAPRRLRLALRDTFAHRFSLCSKTCSTARIAVARAFPFGPGDVRLLVLPPDRDEENRPQLGRVDIADSKRATLASAGLRWGEPRLAQTARPRNDRAQTGFSRECDF